MEESNEKCGDSEGEAVQRQIEELSFRIRRKMLALCEHDSIPELFKECLVVKEMCK